MDEKEGAEHVEKRLIFCKVRHWGVVRRRKGRSEAAKGA